MAKRQTFAVTLTDRATGEQIARAEKHARNSGIRASEALVRDLARAEGSLYGGGPFIPEGDTYRRDWTSEATSRVVIARVALVDA